MNRFSTSLGGNCKYFCYDYYAIKKAPVMRIDFEALNKDRKRPLHQQLADLLRGAIRAGVYLPGDQIESERTLIKHSRLSQPTVTRALRDLAREGWVVRRTGSGTYVNAAPRGNGRAICKIGVFYYDTSTAYFQRLFAGIQNAAQATGLEVTTVPAGMAYEHEDRAIGELEQRGVDSIIAVPFGTELMQRELMRLIRAGMPVISIGVRLPHIPCDAVGLDQQMCGQLVGQHLLDLGHRHFAFLCPEFLYPETSSIDMLTGLRQACAEKGVALNDGRVVQMPTMFNDADDPAPRRLLLDLFGDDEPPTALVCSTDGLAHFAYRVLGNIGRRVPRDLSITGGGDLPMAAQLDPPLTTVAWPLERMGRVAVQMLLDRHDHPDHHPIHRVLDTQLVIRRSSGMAHHA